METKEIINNLIKNGGKQFKNVKVLSCTITPSETDPQLVRAALNTNTRLPFLLTGDDGVSKETTSNIVISSNYALIGILRGNEYAASVIGELQLNPKILEVVMTNSVIEVIQERVAANTDYVNPFTTKEDVTPTQFDHNVIINHITSITISKRAEAKLDALANKILGI